jgi:hypothetical protein
MAVFYRVEVSGNWAEALRDTGILVRRMKVAIDDGCAVVGQRSTELLKRNIRTNGAGLAPLAPGTMLTRQMGKKVGGPGSTTPWPLPAYKRRQPLWRSGSYERAIYMHKVREMWRQVTIRPDAANPQGRNISQLAIKQEFGYSASITMTRRMQAYLLILYGRITPKGSGRMSQAEGDRVVRTISVAVPPRPLWQRTWDANQNNMFVWFACGWANMLRSKWLTV